MAVIQNDLLYSKKKVKLPDDEDRHKRKEQMIISMKEFKNFELNYKRLNSIQNGG